LGKYDISSKVLFKDFIEDFVRLAIKDHDFEIVEEIPTELPFAEIRFIDAPVRVKIDGKDAIVHIEFQTQTSSDPMEYRIAEYIGRLIHKYQMPVYVTIIYLGESAGVDDPGGCQFSLDKTFSYSLQYQVIRISEIDGEKVLSQKLPLGLLPFSALMKRPEGVGKEEWLKRCTKTVLDVDFDSQEKRQSYLGTFVIISNLIHETEFILNLLKEGKTMIDFERFPLIQELTKKARDEGITKGIAEGIAKGITKGISEGITKGQVKSLIKIIETEYGKKGLRQVESRIQAIQDEDKLFALIEPALTSSSLEEFKKTLDGI